MDHDQRFKELIRTFFADFLELFFAEWAVRLDADSVVWLDKEVFPDPPEGPRRILDLVARLPTRQAVQGQASGKAESWLAVVHIEIESPDRARPLRSRMHRSYVYLRDRYGLPVLPIAIFLRVGLNGLGVDVYEENFWEFRALQFQYLYVGLPGLDAIEYLQGDNLLGVALAALMRVPPERAAWLGAEALRRIVEAPLTDQQRFLLGECVEAYLPLDEAQQAEFEQLLASEPYEGVRDVNLTSYEKGVEKGLEKGLERGVAQGSRLIIQRLLEGKFGPLSKAARERLQDLSAEELARLVDRVLGASSLRDLGLEV